MILVNFETRNILLFTLKPDTLDIKHIFFFFLLHKRLQSSNLKKHTHIIVPKTVKPIHLPIVPFKI